MKTSPTVIAVVLTIIAILLMGWYAITPGQYDELAKCIQEKGAVFYGAFWCPHCQDQKKMFNKSADLLPYVECSTQDGKGQMQVCTDNKIEGYPTWEFADGSRISQSLTPEKLAEITGCPLLAE